MADDTKQQRLELGQAFQEAASPFVRQLDHILTQIRDREGVAKDLTQSKDDETLLRNIEHCLGGVGNAVVLCSLGNFEMAQLHIEGYVERLEAIEVRLKAGQESLSPVQPLKEILKTIEGAIQNHPEIFTP